MFLRLHKEYPEVNPSGFACRIKKLQNRRLPLEDKQRLVGALYGIEQDKKQNPALYQPKKT